MDRANWRWAVVFLAAALFHAAVALALFAFPAGAPPVAAGAGGVQIALGRAPATAGATGEPDSGAADADDAGAEPNAEPVPEPTPTLPEPETEVVTEQIEPPRPVGPPPERVPLPEPEPRLDPPGETQQPSEAAPEDPSTDATDTPETTDRSGPTEKDGSGTGETKTVSKDTTGTSTAETRGPNASNATEGSTDMIAGAGNAGAELSYSATLSAWLERHKHYPRRSKRRREEGTALLYLLVARDGRVLDYRVERSAGFAALDEELLAMVERAQPLPAFPTELQAAQMEYVLPVDFTLR